MFGISTGELLILGLIALIVLGPERLPKAARFAGVWIRRARSQWYSVKSELERELAAEELKRSMQDVRRAASDLKQELDASKADIEAGVREAEAQARREFDDVRRQAIGEAPQTDAADAVDDATEAPAQPDLLDPGAAPQQRDLLEHDAPRHAEGDDGRQR